MSEPDHPSWCPSAKPAIGSSMLFGVVTGSVERPRLLHLAEPQVVTQELLALAEPATPTEVFRFTAPCVGGDCQHYDGSACRLATKIVQLMPSVTEHAPPCRIRPNCRWWKQEGTAACLRCPQIVSSTFVPSEALAQAADPHSSPRPSHNL